MSILLRTERLILREFTMADLDALVELDSDPYVMHFITNGVPTSQEEMRDEVLPAFLDYYRRTPGFGFWAAESTKTGDFLGWFHLRPEPGASPTEPELGYRLARPYWGLGLATEGSRALISHAFGYPDIERVTASTMAVHVASRKVMENSGMSLVRTFVADWPVHIDGDEHGDVQYAITRDQWLALKDSASWM